MKFLLQGYLVHHISQDDTNATWLADPPLALTSDSIPKLPPEGPHVQDDERRRSGRAVRLPEQGNRFGRRAQDAKGRDEEESDASC